MKTQWFSLTTGSDVVITREAGTAGALETLDYIPGSALLGALIAGHRLFEPELFMSGRIRCSDALPCSGKELAWPMPLCYFRNKGENDACAKSALASGGSVLGEQLRDSYITDEGVRISIRTAFRMKSGIDRARFGTVKDGQLFGYEAIAAGQEFLFSLSCEDDRLMSSLASVLSGSLRIGRSKSAEYGHVAVRPVEECPRFPGVQSVDARCVLYCASDVCLVQEGVFTTIPSPSAFGLPGEWSLDLGTTFIRTRSYSPWNAFHKRLLSQRFVICRGSILSFTTAGGSSSLRASALDIGLFVEEGLGKVLVDPVFVTAGVKLRVPETGRVARGAGGETNLVRNPLVAFMDRRIKERRAALESLKLGREWATELLNLQKRIEETGKAVPGKSQWGFVRQIAIRSSGGQNDMRDALNELTQDTRKKWWTATVKQNGRETSLHSCLVGLLSRKLSDPVRRLAMMHAAIAVGRGMKPNSKQEEG